MFGIVVLHITSLSTNEIGRYLTPKEILQKGSRPHVGRYCCPARGTVTTFSVRVCISYSDSDVIYTHIHTRAIEGLRGFAKGLRPFELRSLLSPTGSDVLGHFESRLGLAIQLFILLCCCEVCFGMGLLTSLQWYSSP